MGVEPKKGARLHVATWIAPAMLPTPAELDIVAQIFATADLKNQGFISGEVAVVVLLRSHLSAEVLGEIWAIADKNNDGYLTRETLAVVVRLIGHAQNNGGIVDESLVGTGAHACLFFVLCWCSTSVY